MGDNKVNGPMKQPPHPGQVLKGLYLDALNLTITEAAEGLGITRKTLSLVVNGHSAVSPVMAIKLSEAFNTSPQLWLNMQLNFDLFLAGKKERSQAVRNFWPAKANGEEKILETA